MCWSIYYMGIKMKYARVIILKVIDKNLSIKIIYLIVAIDNDKSIGVGYSIIEGFY